MFMGIASEITKVEEDVIHLQGVYSNSVKESKAEILARTWLKSPKNSFLLEADTIVVTEYTDRGKPGSFVILDDEEGITHEEAFEKLNAEEHEQFGETKRLIARHVFVVDALIEDVNY